MNNTRQNAKSQTVVQANGTPQSEPSTEVKQQPGAEVAANEAVTEKAEAPPADLQDIKR